MGSRTKNDDTKEQVKEILQRAFEGTLQHFGEMGRFWERLDALEQAQVYGVPLIAGLEKYKDDDELLSSGANAAAKSSGSGAPAHKTSAGVLPRMKLVRPRATRADYSGLIAALRGTYPFDGHFLPKLVREAAPESDVAVVADWINGDPFLQLKTAAKAAAKAQAPTFEVLSTAKVFLNARRCGSSPGSCSIKLMRKNLDNFTPEEERRLRRAYRIMVEKNKVPMRNNNALYWARLHGDECQHAWEQFLTWHRMFLFEFEQALQDIDVEVTLPYWDWLMPEYANNGDLPTGTFPTFNGTLPAQAGTIPKALRCWIDADSIDHVAQHHSTTSTPPGPFTADQIDRLRAIVDIRYNSGYEFMLAAGLTAITNPVNPAIPDPAQNFAAQRDLLYPILGEINPLWYQFRYPGMFYAGPYSGLTPYGSPAAGTKIGFNAAGFRFPTRQEVDRILSLTTWADFGGGPIEDPHYGALDQGPHNMIHLFSGGTNPLWVKADCTASNDSGSQNANEPMQGDMFNNLIAGYDFIFWPHHANLDRLYAQWQRRFPNQGPAAPGEALPGLGYIVADAASIHNLCYEYVYDCHQYPTPNRGSSFVGEAFALTDNLRNYAGKIQVRLHNVATPATPVEVHVFLNAPKANASTPRSGDSYGGYFVVSKESLQADNNLAFDITGTFNRVKVTAKDISVALVVTAKGSGTLSMQGFSVVFSEDNQ